MEFAKKFFVPERADMVPMKELVAARLSLRLISAYAARYELSWAQLVRFQDWGYKIGSKVQQKIWTIRNSRLRVLLVWLTCPGQAWGRKSVGEWLAMKSYKDNWPIKGLPWESVHALMREDLLDLRERYWRRTEQVKRQLTEAGAALGLDGLKREVPFAERVHALYNEVESASGE
jgi:hypothetical protein